jgi:hypothetical protein
MTMSKKQIATQGTMYCASLEFREKKLSGKSMFGCQVINFEYLVAKITA